MAYYGDDAFGVGRYAEPGPGVQDPLAERYRFAGEPYDAETRHYSLRARRYDPDTGRFTTPDPIGHAGGDNLYAYADNNPVARTNLTARLAGRSSDKQVPARGNRPGTSAAASCAPAHIQAPLGSRLA